jgi:hypothetical protein
MIKDGEVRPEGCICEPCSDISPNWRDMRTQFGYTALSAIPNPPLFYIRAIFITFTHYFEFSFK